MSVKIRGFIFLIAALAFPLLGQAQQTSTLSNQASPPPTVEPVDASFVPVVESKSPALEVVSATRRDPFIRIRLRNTSDKNIYAFRMRYHKAGAAILHSFVMADTKTMVAPGEVYRYDWPFSPSSSLAREALIFEAVIFQDGSGDGEPEKVKSLQDLFLTNMRELEYEIALLEAALNSPNIETVQGLEEDLQHVLDHIFIVINAYNATYKIAKEAREALEKHYPEFLLKQVIRQCTKFAQASSEGIPIFAYDPESKGAQDIQAVLDEVQARVGAPVRLKAVESA